MASGYQGSYPHPPPNGRDDVRLPSIKDLNFPQHRAQEASTAPTNGSQVEHARNGRHDASPWSRSSASSASAVPQHAQSMPPPHENSKIQYPATKADAPYTTSSQQAPPPPAGPGNAGPPSSRGDPSPQNSSKRPRSDSIGVSAPPGRSHVSIVHEMSRPAANRNLQSIGCCLVQCVPSATPVICVCTSAPIVCVCASCACA